VNAASSGQQIYRFLDSLRPTGYGDLNVEPFENYVPIARTLLPNFPDDVLEQWIWRHYSDAVNQYGWLGLRELVFTRQTWDTERLLQLVQTFPGSALVDSLTASFRSKKQIRNHGLALMMLRDGTWPVPILVLRNVQRLTRPDGLPLGSPYHLVEGHRRLGYLRAMSEDDRWTPSLAHEVWLLEYEPSSVLSFWPMNDAFRPAN
jgi:hypothetical protein